MQTATVRWIAGEEFTATLPSGHSVSFDADRKHNAAPGPMEMLLGALGACTSVDVVMILAKKRQRLTSLEPDIARDRHFRRACERAAIGMDKNRDDLSASRRPRT